MNLMNLIDKTQSIFEHRKRAIERTKLKIGTKSANSQSLFMS